VADKSGIAQFAQRLAALHVDILSTAGTARLLREHGVPVEDVTDYTGFPDILGGSVRTLHPKVHGGLLARREHESHLEELKRYGIRAIDMVVVNLFPFVDVIPGAGPELVQAVDNIDVDGTTIIRSAAKNYTHVAVLANPAMYDSVAAELEQNEGALSERTHFMLALEAFRHTAHYDATIVQHLESMRDAVLGGPAG
jgi:phosphoribosylaminoimidazolecarboxamide formyltransferase/IMP cyclohydrolase